LQTAQYNNSYTHAALTKCVRSEERREGEKECRREGVKRGRKRKRRRERERESWGEALEWLN